MNTTRIMLSPVAHFGWELHWFDGKNVFLSFMETWRRKFISRFHLDMILLMERIRCVSWKRLYMVWSNLPMHGLASSKRLVSLGYRESQGDHTLFFNHSQKRKFTILLVYIDYIVDYIIISGDDLIERQQLKERVYGWISNKGFWKPKVLPWDWSYPERGFSILQAG